MIAIYTGRLRGLIAEERRDKLPPEPKTADERLLRDQTRTNGGTPCARSTTHSQPGTSSHLKNSHQGGEPSE